MRRWFDIALLRMRSLAGKGAVERDLGRELSFHLEQQVAENIAAGMTPLDARYAAARSFGGAAQIEEECRDMRGTSGLETIGIDVRYAVRILRRAPGFTAVIILTLALSIGATSAIFSLIEGVLLRPLPYPQADRIVRIFFKGQNFPKFPLNPFDLRDFRSRNRTFESVAAITRADVQLAGAGAPVVLNSFKVTAGYFHVLGLRPARGREFTTEDELPEHYRIAVISDRLWKTRFASDANIIGRTITLNAESYAVVGVMPPGVEHPGNDYHAVTDGDTVDVWRPYSYVGDPNQRGSHFVEGIGRLKPGVSPDQAGADLNAILSQLAHVHEQDQGWRVYLVPLYRETVGRMQLLLMVLLGAVGLLLLIACVNAANLLLARSTAREREMAVRLAIGARRGRLVRQLLTESLLIALASAGLGTLLAVGGVRALVALLPAGFPRASSIRLDPMVFLFTLGVAVVTGILFGLAPALAGSRTELQTRLREGGRNATGSQRQVRLRNALVVGEMGLACLLLITAGLMLHSFVNLLRSDPGFRPEHVLTAAVSLPYKQYPELTDKLRFADQLIAKLQELPGVQAAGIATDLPWTGYDENTSFTVEGRSPAANRDNTARYHTASPDFFRALGVPLVEGRFVNAHDDKKAPPVLVINRAMARRYWPGENALGKRVTFEDQPKEKDWFQIVGVVGDVLDQPNSEQAHPAFWTSLRQAWSGGDDMSVTVRSVGDAADVSNRLRGAVAQIDSGLALAELRPMQEIASAAVSTQRFALFLVGLFALLALVLSTIGIYGVLSYSVSQRTHEFGMRLALGAKSSDLMGMILGQGIRLSAAGIAMGMLAAVACARILGKLLYGVSSADPITFLAVAALSILTATLACYVPARRATEADPMQSLRSE